MDAAAARIYPNQRFCFLSNPWRGSVYAGMAVEN